MRSLSCTQPCCRLACSATWKRIRAWRDPTCRAFDPSGKLRIPGKRNEQMGSIERRSEEGKKTGGMAQLSRDSRLAKKLREGVDKQFLAVLESGLEWNGSTLWYVF